jgi:hypothetical protein
MKGSGDLRSRFIDVVHRKDNRKEMHEERIMMALHERLVVIEFDTLLDGEGKNFVARHCLETYGVPL